MDTQADIIFAKLQRDGQSQGVCQTQRLGLRVGMGLVNLSSRLSFGQGAVQVHVGLI
jgi:hypothetical protein